MPEDVVYRSSLAWNAGRPATVVITCVDGRWYGHFQEFARAHLDAGPQIDFIALPGGVEPFALADAAPNDYDTFRRRLKGLLALRNVRRIVAIGHDDCGWYKARTIGSADGAARELQIADLGRAAAVLREMAPDATVELYFARLAKDAPEQVVFESVPTLP